MRVDSACGRKFAARARKPGKTVMKALIPLLLVSTSALAVTTFQFAQRASAERKRADDATSLNVKNQTRIRELEESRGSIEHQLMEAQRPVMPAPDANLAKHTAPASAPPAIAQFSVLNRLMPQNLPLTRMAGGGFMMGPSSPAAQRYQRLQLKNSLHRQYADVASSLGLSQGQADKLLDLLAEQRMPPAMAGAHQSGDSVKQQTQGWQESVARTEAAMTSLLGERGMAQWQDYQKTIGQHVQANMMADQMQNMGAPITEEQRGELYRISVEEPMRSPQLSLQGPPSEDTWKEMQKIQDERERAILERSRSVLTSEQFERYSDYVAWQSEMRKSAFGNARPGMAGATMPMAVPGPNTMTFSLGSASGSITSTGPVSAPDAGSSPSPKP